MRVTMALIAASAFAATPLLAQSAPRFPGFWDLEMTYQKDPTLTASRAALTAAIPAGAPLREAETQLVNAGAECKAKRKEPTVTRCLIHQYSLADGAADDIRWIVSLQASGDRVAALSVGR